MAPESKTIVELIESRNATPADFAHVPLPPAMRAATVHRAEQQMFRGVASCDRDPRKSLHVDEVALPPLGPGEAIVAVMASAINYNTVWSALFEPLPTFKFLERFAGVSALHARHNLDYHIVGGDAARFSTTRSPGKES